jgi:putative membrane protein
MAGESSRPGEQSTRERFTGFVRARRGSVAVYLKGFAMGAAGTVPGVSGGTIALVTGIYDRLIGCVTRLDGSLLRLVPRLYRREARSKFLTRVREGDLAFLGILLAGYLTAIFTLAQVITAALDAAPGPTFAFFGGLIGASALVLFDTDWVFQPARIAAGVFGFVVAFGIAGASGSGVLPETAPFVFLAATISVSGMVLPGISGSFMLLLLGLYEYMTGAAAEFGSAVSTLVTGGNAEGLVTNGSVIGIYAVGAVVGFLTTAHVVERALERYPGTTFVFLVSLMVGALRYPILRVSETTETAAGPLAAVAAAALVGGGFILLVDHYTDDLEYDEYE